jgi:hypothetical protein
LREGLQRIADATKLGKDSSATIATAEMRGDGLGVARVEPAVEMLGQRLDVRAMPARAIAVRA